MAPKCPRRSVEPGACRRAESMARSWGERGCKVVPGTESVCCRGWRRSTFADTSPARCRRYAVVVRSTVSAGCRLRALHPVAHQIREQTSSELRLVPGGRQQGCAHSEDTSRPRGGCKVGG